MADMKSMMPDFKDVTTIATKLFKDVKKSVSEIVTDYKAKHCCPDETTKTEEKTSNSKTTKTKDKD
jgi:hypothetical protein